MLKLDALQVSLMAILVPALWGCDPGLEADTDAPPGYTYALSFENQDLVTYSIRLEWIEQGATQSLVLDVLEAGERSEWWIDVIPAVPYELVLVDVRGWVLDTASLDPLTVASRHPSVRSFLILNRRLIE